MEPFHYLLIIFTTTLLSAFFTGIEITLTRVWKMQLEIDLAPNSFLSKLKKAVRSNPEKYIATLVIGNYFVFVVCIIAFSGLLFPLFEKHIHSKSIVILFITAISAVTFLLFGKLIPKTVVPFLSNKPIHILLISASFFSFLLYPLTGPILKISNTFLKKLLKPDQNSALANPIFNRIENQWFMHKNDLNEIEKKKNKETEVKLFKNALDFSKVKLREIMVPRTEIVVLDLNSTIEELRQKFVETGFSRIIFYEDNIDNIVGYVHSSVIFKNPDSFKPFINDVLIVPETMPANKLLSTFIREHRSIAIVVDEFGGTSGMVTSEDILEEIFGEIEDEHDTSDIFEKQISETEFIISGRSEIDLLNEKFQINLPETEDFETLAGFILFNHESIPKINSVIKIGIFQFKILKATNTRIELIKLTIVED
jgi:CBS domain containing-hemolysin-like protein